MRIYFVGVHARQRLPVLFLFSLFLLAVALARYLGAERLLPSGSFLRADWGRYILASVLPLPSTGGGAVSWSVGWNAAELQTPRGWLENQMPILAASRGGHGVLPAVAVPAVPEVPEEEGEEEVEPLPPEGEDLGGGASSAPGPAGEPGGGPVGPGADEVRVFVYNTHNAESYVPDYGVAKVPGQAGGVSRVAAALVAALEAEGVRAVLSPTIHDYPDFNRSYTNSAATVRQALSAYPSLELIVDVHRDAGRSRPDVAVVNGQKVAQILLVVGTDRRLPHPNWQKNLDFAKRIEAKMNELYPGLSRGVRPQDGRYNQHLHPHAILVEIGNHLNTLEEAEASARLLARVLKEVI